MTTSIKSAANELKSLVSRIAKVDELLKDVKESDKGALKLADAVKEAQEQYKAYLAANLDFFTLTEEKKGLEKELKQGCKAATKGSAIKPAMLVAFLKAQAKEDSVDKQIDKGALFNSLKSQTA